MFLLATSLLVHAALAGITVMAQVKKAIGLPKL
jgi:hypothetical protein